jgi:hypothetical protein
MDRSRGLPRQAILSLANTQRALRPCAQRTHVRYGSKADIVDYQRHVRFTPEERHAAAHDTDRFYHLTTNDGRCACLPKKLMNAGDSDCGDPSPARYVSQRAHHCAGVVAPFRTPRHMQIDYRTGRLVGISRHAHIYEDTAIIATALDINARLCVLGQRCRCLVPAGWGEAHLKSRYTSIARSFIRPITRIGIAVDKLVVRFCA